MLCNSCHGRLDLIKIESSVDDIHEYKFHSFYEDTKYIYRCRECYKVQIVGYEKFVELEEI